MGLHQLHSVTITSDISNIPVSQSTHEAEPKTTIGANASLGLLEQVDVGADMELSVIPMLQTRFRL